MRDLQRHVAAVLRRVRAGETLGVTDRGTLVAILAPPDNPGGRAAGLVAAGRVRAATRSIDELARSRGSEFRTTDALEEQRQDR